MNFIFTGEVWFWKGPAPFYFVTVPEDESREIKSMEKMVTYGWGMIPATVTVGKTEFKTALWPKDDRYIVPLKVAIRKAENISEHDKIQITLDI
ncbi:DUF1905 domain-containing protein [soil metagenome]